MKYTIRPAGSMNELVQKGQAKIYRQSPDEDGGRVEVGDYKGALLPGGGKSHRVKFDTGKREYDIALSNTELSAIAKGMRLIDPLTKKIIETADKFNEYDPFFIHEKLEIDIPNAGVTLDTDTDEGKYWWHAIESEPKVFDIDNSTDNPLVKKVQTFRVTTAGHSEAEVSQDIKEGQRATAIFHAIKNDFKQMVDICRGLDITIGENPNIDALRDAIYLKITTQKDWKTKDGTRCIDKFLALADMAPSEREIRAKVGEAISLGIITRSGKNYEYDQTILGNNPDKVFAFLSKPDEKNQAILKDILEQILATAGVLV